MKKVVIPKYVAEWLQVCKENLAVSLLFAMTPDVLETNKQSEETIYWMKSVRNQEIFARAWLDGYEIEKEKVYRIPLKGLMTTDGEQQYLTGKAGKYFASRWNSSLRQTFTQTELDNNVPAYLRNLAKEVTDEQD